MVNEAALRARFDVIAVDGEGLLLDREGGGVYRLNHTACEIWTAILDGKSAREVSGALARRFGLGDERAATDVVAALERLPDLAPKPPIDPFRWSVTETGYGFFEGERLICEVDAGAGSLRLGPDLHPTEPQARGCLKTVVPKLLALRGVFVLHASAVELAGNLRIFSGRSGAGKTTSARAFARAGAQLVSEDLLVLAASNRQPHAVVGGEPAIRAWIAQQGARLARAPAEVVDAAPLDRCLEGPTLPIAEVWLVDAGRRAGCEIRLDRLTALDALVPLIESAFFASADARQWRARFVPLRDLAVNAAISRATIPDGLAALDGAVASLGQSATTAS